MQSKLYTLLGMVLLALVVIGCSSDEEPSVPNLTGTYSGTFTVEYPDGDTFSNSVTVSFMAENKYNSNGNDNYYPAGGSGTYEVEASKINFEDINYWTANFDWNLILNGEYDYSLNGSELIISAAKNDMGLYTYELEKE